MSVERAVHRLTRELGQWMGMGAGVLAQDQRADVVAGNPKGLDEKVDIATEAAMEYFGGFVRPVRCNDAAQVPSR